MHIWAQPLSLGTRRVDPGAEHGPTGAISHCVVQGGIRGLIKRGGYPAVLAAVAVGTLGPHLQRAVVRVAAGVGALLRGEMETASPRGLSPPFPFPSLLSAPSPPLKAPPLGLSPFGTTQAPREDPSPCHVERIGAAHPAPYLHLPAVTVLSLLQKAVATLAAHHQVLGVGQVEETHASSLLEVVLQLPLAAGAEDAREGVAAQGTDGEGWEPGRSGPGEGGKPQSELGNKDTGKLAQTLPGAAAAAAPTRRVHQNLHLPPQPAPLSTPTTKHRTPTAQDPNIWKTGPKCFQEWVGLGKQSCSVLPLEEWISSKKSPGDRRS